MRLRYTVLLLAITFLTSCTKDELFEDPDAIQVLVVEETDDVINSSETTQTTETNSIQSTAQMPADIEVQLFGLINNHRESINLQSFTFEDNTYIEAGKHTDYMISEGHTSHAKFSQRAAEIAKKTSAKHVAENVAKDYPTIQRALEAWLESPGHKKNIEGNYTHSAISIKEDANGNLYFTQIFFR